MTPREQLNNHEDTDILEKKIPETLEGPEENVVNQDPDYGVLSKARAFETRKHLFDLIEKAKKEKDEKNLLKIKKEINEIIGKGTED